MQNANYVGASIARPLGKTKLAYRRVGACSHRINAKCKIDNPSTDRALKCKISLYCRVGACSHRINAKCKIDNPSIDRALKCKINLYCRVGACSHRKKSTTQKSAVDEVLGINYFVNFIFCNVTVLSNGLYCIHFLHSLLHIKLNVVLN